MPKVRVDRHLLPIEGSEVLSPLDTESIGVVMRQDPDVILVGEMRDPETAMAALIAAEIGHLVLSLLHTTDATETVNRTVAQGFAPARRGGKLPVWETLLVTGRVQQCILNPGQTHQIHDIIEEDEFYEMQSFDGPFAHLVAGSHLSL